MAGPIVTLLTDFGLADVYAGVMKGVVAARAPGAAIVDLSHEIAPQDVFGAAVALESAWHHFPAGSIHLVVVDPGVGTPRRRLAIATAGQYFVGPDNGCLSAALSDEARGMRPAGGTYEERPVLLPPSVAAFAIEDLDRIGAGDPSATFEGRDVFAPAAAYLAAGGRPEELGPPVTEVLAFPAFKAPPGPGGLDGVVIAVDRYGNLITDILATDLPEQPRFVVAGSHIAGLSRTYGAATVPAAIAGSSGRIEVALPGRSAAEIIGAGRGDRVRVSN